VPYEESQTHPAQEPRDELLVKLVDKAMARPGVAEAIAVYSRATSAIPRTTVRSRRLRSATGANHGK
jgi:hypothetical protein